MAKLRPKPQSIEVAVGDKRPVGRPKAPYKPEVAMVLLNRMADGESIRKIVESDKEFFPSRGLIWEWRQDHPEFESKYQLARKAQVEAMLDDTVHLPDTAHELTPVEQNFVGLRVRTRQWYIEKVNPKEYGPHINHENTVTVKHEHTELFENLTPAERESLRDMLEKAQSRQEKARLGVVIEGKAKRRA